MTPETWSRSEVDGLRARALCGILTALALIGCGPGLGGTGTGAPTPDSFGATAQAVCDSSLASRLDCQSGAPAAPTAAPVSAAGTAPVRFTDGASVPSRAEFDGNRVIFDVRCGEFDFSGEWARAGAADPRFYGGVRRHGTDPASPATLAVATGPGSALVVSLFDAGGTLLAGPFTLLRESSPGGRC